MNAQLLFLAALLSCIVGLVASIPINYDPNRAMRHLVYSKIAYCNQSDGLDETWSCPCCHLVPGFRLFSIYNNATNDLQVYTGYDPTQNEIVIAYRGTWDAAGWAVDFMTDLVPSPVITPGCAECKMHEGYHGMYMYYRSQLWANVQKLAQTYPTASLRIAGHSLGGGLSQITLLDFSANMPNLKPMAYTFGTPRLGNPALVQYTASVIAPGNNVRITHKHDPIPRTPTEIGGYLHFPQEVYYNNDLGPNNYTSLCVAETYTAEDESCIDSVPFYELNPMDHLLYLGISTRCNCDPAKETLEELKKDRQFAIAQMKHKKLMMDLKGRK